MKQICCFLIAVALLLLFSDTSGIGIGDTYEGGLNQHLSQLTDTR